MIFKDFLNEEMLFEMANFQTSDSGLPYNIWLDSAGKQRLVEHDIPRLKIEIEPKNLVPFSVSKKPKCLLKHYDKHIKDDGISKKIKKVYKWIIKNYDILMMHWNGEISDFEAMKRFERI